MYVKTGFYEVGVAPGVAIRLQSVADLMRRDGLILSDTEWFLIRPQSGKARVPQVPICRPLLKVNLRH